MVDIGVGPAQIYEEESECLESNPAAALENLMDHFGGC